MSVVVVKLLTIFNVENAFLEGKSSEVQCVITGGSEGIFTVVY